MLIQDHLLLHVGSVLYESVDCLLVWLSQRMVTNSLLYPGSESVCDEPKLSNFFEFPMKILDLRFEFDHISRAP